MVTIEANDTGMELNAAESISLTATNDSIELYAGQDIKIHDKNVSTLQPVNLSDYPINWSAIVKPSVSNYLGFYLAKIAVSGNPYNTFVFEISNYTSQIRAYYLSYSGTLTELSSDWKTASNTYSYKKLF